MANYNRSWQQELEYGDNNVSVLLLRSPEGHTSTHWFSTRLWDQVALRSWSEMPHGYAHSGSRDKSLYLHWLALNKQTGEGNQIHVDHINGNVRDSRDSNLRIVPRRQNNHNKSAVSEHGRCISKDKTVYRVNVKFSGDFVYRPTFKSLDDAILCRDLYMDIAYSYDAGVMPIPAHTELKDIVAEIKKVR